MTLEMLIEKLAMVVVASPSIVGAWILFEEWKGRRRRDEILRRLES